MSYMKAKHVAILLIALLLSSCSGNVVKRVVDGDTIELWNDEKVRYIGIDTPETVHPSKPVEYFGKEASEYNKNLVKGKKVKLEQKCPTKRSIWRLLAYV